MKAITYEASDRLANGSWSRPSVLECNAAVIRAGGDSEDHAPATSGSTVLGEPAACTTITAFDDRATSRPPRRRINLERRAKFGMGAFSAA